MIQCIPLNLIIFLFTSTCLSTSIKIDYVTSAMVRTDPILAPNGLSGHVHTFFGASIADPSTTYEDLRNPSTGNSGNVVENKSLYWYPTIYRYEPAQDRYFVAPIFHHSSYYIWNTGEATAFPDGFKMIIHATDSCTVERDNGNIFHRCGKATAECVAPGSCPNGDCSVLNGFFPPQSCAELEMSIELPSCWDGVSIDSADHRSHVHYGYDDGAQTCPPSHPTRVPKVFVFTRILNYPGGKHLFSDGTGIFHTDYFSGWVESELQYVLDNCSTDSTFPAPDSFCDNGRAGYQNGFTSDPQFLTYVDAPKFVSMEMVETQVGFDIDFSDKIALVTPQIDTSHITTEAIDGVRLLPGSRPSDVVSTTSTVKPTTTLRETTSLVQTTTSTPQPTTTSQSATDLEFYQSTSGSCPSGTSYATQVECEAASEVLNMEIRRIFQNSRRPRGCYQKGGRLFFNRDDSFIDENETTRTSICVCSGPCNISDEDSDDESSEQEAEFFISLTGSCPNKQYIIEREMCEDYAEQSGLDLRRVFKSSNQLRGCYIFRNKVFFNRDTTLTNPSTKSSRKSICMSFQ